MNMGNVPSSDTDPSTLIIMPSPVPHTTLLTQARMRQNGSPHDKVTATPSSGYEGHSSLTPSHPPEPSKSPTSSTGLNSGPIESPPETESIHADNQRGMQQSGYDESRQQHPHMWPLFYPETDTDKTSLSFESASHDGFFNHDPTSYPEGLVERGSRYMSSKSRSENSMPNEHRQLFGGTVTGSEVMKGTLVKTHTSPIISKGTNQIAIGGSGGMPNDKPNGLAKDNDNQGKATALNTSHLSQRNVDLQKTFDVVQSISDWNRSGSSDDRFGNRNRSSFSMRNPKINSDSRSSQETNFHNANQKYHSNDTSHRHESSNVNHSTNLFRGNVSQPQVSVSQQQANLRDNSLGFCSSVGSCGFVVQADSEKYYTSANDSQQFPSSSSQSNDAISYRSERESISMAKDSSGRFCPENIRRDSVKVKEEAICSTLASGVYSKREPVESECSGVYNSGGFASPCNSNALPSYLSEVTFSNTQIHSDGYPTSFSRHYTNDQRNRSENKIISEQQGATHAKRLSSAIPVHNSTDPGGHVIGEEQHKRDVAHNVMMTQRFEMPGAMANLSREYTGPTSYKSGCFSNNSFQQGQGTFGSFNPGLPSARFDSRSLHSQMFLNDTGQFNPQVNSYDMSHASGSSLSSQCQPLSEADNPSNLLSRPHLPATGRSNQGRSQQSSPNTNMLKRNDQTLSLSGQNRPKPSGTTDSPNAQTQDVSKSHQTETKFKDSKANPLWDEKNVIPDFWQNNQAWDDSPATSSLSYAIPATYNVKINSNHNSSRATFTDDEKMRSSDSKDVTNHISPFDHSSAFATAASIPNLEGKNAQTGSTQPIMRMAPCHERQGREGPSKLISPNHQRHSVSRPPIPSKPSALVFRAQAPPTNSKPISSNTRNQAPVPNSKPIDSNFRNQAPPIASKPTTSFIRAQAPLIAPKPPQASSNTSKSNTSIIVRAPICPTTSNHEPDMMLAYRQHSNLNTGGLGVDETATWVKNVNNGRRNEINTRETSINPETSMAKNFTVAVSTDPLKCKTNAQKNVTSVETKNFIDYETNVPKIVTFEKTTPKNVPIAGSNNPINLETNAPKNVTFAGSNNLINSETNAPKNVTFTGSNNPINLETNAPKNVPIAGSNNPINLETNAPKNVTFAGSNIVIDHGAERPYNSHDHSLTDSGVAGSRNSSNGGLQPASPGRDEDEQTTPKQPFLDIPVGVDVMQLRIQRHRRAPPVSLPDDEDDVESDLLNEDPTAAAAGVPQRLRPVDGLEEYGSAASPFLQPDLDALSVYDRPGQRCHYDAYLLVSEEDKITFGRPFLHMLETWGLRICYSQRDLTLTGCFYNNIALMVERRCNSKVIAVVSSNYASSPECQFLTAFARSLDPDARNRNIVPVYIDKVIPDLPPILSGLAIIRYNQVMRRGWLKDKIIGALDI